MTSWKILSLSAALFLLVIVGCSKADSKLVGKWQNERLPETVEFFENKTGVFEVKDKPSLTFKWSISGDDKVLLDIAIGGSTGSLSGKFDKDLLELEGGIQRATYRKLKR